MVNGVFQLDSAVGNGTTIRVIIPLTDEAIERLRRGG
jgi:chemotaxis protein histidine kinase CheA